MLQNTLIVWEVFVNFAEAFLFLLLIFSKLSLKKKSVFLFPISIFFLTAIVCLLNFLHISSLVSFFLILIIDIAYSIIFFKNIFSEKLFWGSIYTFIKLFSDKLAFLIASFFTSYQLNEFLIGGNGRITVSIIYLFVCSVFVFCFIRMKDKAFSLPKKIQIAFILLMTFSIYISDSLLTLIIDISSSTIHAKLLPTLNKINCLSLILSIFLFFMIKWIGSIYTKNMELLEKVEQEKIEMQQFEILAETTQTLREWKHDYKNNLGVISLLLDDDRSERAISYINELLDSDTSSAFKLSSGNTVLDAIISTKISSAKKLGIEFEHLVFLPPNVPLSSLDFSTIMGNFLDNALEACGRLDESVKPFISLNIKPYFDMLYIEIINSSNGNYSYTTEGKLISSKTEKGHGIGVKRSIQVIEKYHGIYQQLAENDKFTITIMIPLTKPEEVPEKLSYPVFP